MKFIINLDSIEVFGKKYIYIPHFTWQDYVTMMQSIHCGNATNFYQRTQHSTCVRIGTSAIEVINKFSIKFIDTYIV